MTENREIYLLINIYSWKLSVFPFWSARTYIPLRLIEPKWGRYKDASSVVLK